MSDMERLVEKIVKKIAQEAIGSEILSVHAVSDLDHYGDEIYRIKVVFEPNTKGGLLDSNKTTGLVRRILPRLGEKGAAGFPILSYISVSDYQDYKKAHPEST